MFPFDLDLFLLGHLERWSGLVLEVLGDFNVDISKHSTCTDKQKLEQFFHNFHLQEIIHPMPTTDLQTTIDHIYTNIDQRQSGVLETYFSYHKAVWIAVGLQWTLYWYTFLTIGGLSGNVSYQCFSQSLTTIAYRYGLDKINRSKWYLRKCVPYIPV